MQGVAHVGKRKINKRAPLKTTVRLPLLPDIDRLPNIDRVVSEKQAAEILGYSPDTLRREFRAGRGPPRVRLSGRRIGYRLSMLYAYLEKNTEQPGARKVA
jgi:predicted DNA-binding transcriptional regulator AlpA